MMLSALTVTERSNHASRSIHAAMTAIDNSRVPDQMVGIRAGAGRKALATNPETGSFQSSRILTS